MTRDLTRPDPLTIAQAAAECDRSYRVVFDAIERGELPTLPRTGQRHLIARAAFERWRAALPPKRQRTGLRAKFKGK